MNRRRFLGGVAAVSLGAVAGCTGTGTEKDYDEQYSTFDVDVPAERHGDAIENLFDVFEMINSGEGLNESQKEDLDIKYLAYHDDGETATIDVEEKNEDTWESAGEQFVNRIVTTTFLAEYATSAENPPERYVINYTTSGTDEPHKTQEASHDEMVTYHDEELADNDTEVTD